MCVFLIHINDVTGIKMPGKIFLILVLFPYNGTYKGFVRINRGSLLKAEGVQKIWEFKTPTPKKLRLYNRVNPVMFGGLDQR